MQDSVEKTFIIYIHYAREDEKLLRDKLRLNSKLNLVTVDTSQDIVINNKIIRNNILNKYFEFSGYYFGLKKVKEIVGDENVRVIFINDTIFDSHLTMFYIKMINDLSNIQFEESNLITGIVQNKPNYDIIPTCIFSFNIVDWESCFETLLPEEFQLNIDSPIEEIDVNNLFIGDEKIYHSRVNDWLEPKSIFKGWYKASPFKETDKKTIERKKLTIYLEHRLLLYSKSMGFNSLDYFEYHWFMRYFYKLDVIFQLSIKIKYRLKLWLKNKYEK